MARYFPQLEILETLGHGGMGAVYKARQPKLDRLVALKIIRPELAVDSAFAERFVREARTLARLSHPSVVGIHDFGEVVVPEEGGPVQTLYYLIMEYVDGTNLRALMTDVHLQPSTTLALISQVCEALQYAHDEGVVHRDIKPENILLDQRGRAKIADFGLAKLATGSAADLTLTGTHQVLGTPRYMAPEQMEGTRAVDHRADIYSLGVVLYELLTGVAPVGHFEAPSQRTGVDPRLDEVVTRALARDPGSRFQSASEFRSCIESIRGGEALSVASRQAAQGGQQSPWFSSLLNRELVGAWRTLRGLPSISGREASPFPGVLMIVLCIAGCLLTLFPWVRITITDPQVVPGGSEYRLEVDMTTDREITDLEKGGPGTPVHEPYVMTPIGLDQEAGGVTIAMLVALGLLLLVTPAQVGPTLRRSGFMLAMSAISLLAVILYLWQIESNSPPVSSTRLSGLEHRLEPLAAWWGAVTATTLLLLLSASVVRRAVVHAASEPSHAEPGTFATGRGDVLASHRFRTVTVVDVFSQSRFHFLSLGYRLLETGPDYCVFQRGSVRKALMATDIRRYPTTLTIRTAASSENRQWVSCEWAVVTLGSWILNSDIEALKAEGIEFEAFLEMESQGPSASFATSQIERQDRAIPRPGQVVVAAGPVTADRTAASQSAISAEVDGPSLVMLVVGFLMVVGNAILVVRLTSDPSLEREVGVVFGVVGILIGIAMLRGGYSLRRLSRLGLAQLGALACFVPAGPGWLLTLPVGVWAWRTISRPHVRAAFRREPSDRDLG